ncbi:hypothetical protein EJ07DRAFT_159220 [Lizonia empirigonia]|nr:hypothetical protein EJ07DRAFT_159220 [Lizonia empirigonia]
MWTAGLSITSTLLSFYVAGATAQNGVICNSKIPSGKDNTGLETSANGLAMKLCDAHVKDSGHTPFVSDKGLDGVVLTITHSDETPKHATARAPSLLPGRESTSKPLMATGSSSCLGKLSPQDKAAKRTNGQHKKRDEQDAKFFFKKWAAANRGDLTMKDFAALEGVFEKDQEYVEKMVGNTIKLVTLLGRGFSTKRQRGDALHSWLVEKGLYTVLSFPMDLLEIRHTTTSGAGRTRCR